MYNDLLENEEHYQHFVSTIKNKKHQYRHYVISTINKDNLAQLIQKLFNDGEYFCVYTVAKSQKIPTFLLQDLDIQNILTIVEKEEKRLVTELYELLQDSLKVEENIKVQNITFLLKNILLRRESSCSFYELDDNVITKPELKNKSRYFQLLDIVEYIILQKEHIANYDRCHELLSTSLDINMAVYYITQRHMDCSEIETTYNIVARYLNMSNTNTPKLKSLKKSNIITGVIASNSNISNATLALLLAKYNREQAEKLKSEKESEAVDVNDEAEVNDNES